MTHKQNLIALLAKVEAEEVIVADDLYHISEHSHPGVQVSWALSFMPANSGSLDAAQALHKAVLPEYEWTFYYDGECGVQHHESANVFHTAWDKTPSRAWLIAIIKALIAEEE